MLQPESRGHRSYYEAFTRRRNLTPDVLARENLLTDRGAYLNFLEVQLERVSAACLAAQDCHARMVSVAAQASAAEDKVLSATKLVRLAQTYSEEQGREQARINDVLEERLAHLERNFEVISGVLPDQVEFQSRERNDRGVRSDDSTTGTCGVPPRLSPVASDEPLIASPCLSRWMLDVDKRLSSVQMLVAVSQEGEATAEAAAVSASQAYRTSGTAGAEQVGEAGQNTSAMVALPVASESAALTRVEDRLQKLEASFLEAPISLPQGTSSAEPVTPYAQKREDAGQAQAACTSARPVNHDEGPGSRGRGGSGTPSGGNPSNIRNRSLTRSSVMADIDGDDEATAGLQAGCTANDLLQEVNQGREEAKKACEAAEEALRIGKEAAERSERTETLAKTMAVRSMKFAREQHEHVSDALARLDDTLRHQRMSDGHHRQNGETGRLRDEHESEKPPEAIIPCALDAEFVAGLAGSADGRAADKDSGPGSNWTRTRRRGRPTREGVEANEHDGAKPRSRGENRRCGTGGSADPGVNRVADRRSDLNDPSLKNIRRIIDALPTVSGDERRIALSAAQTAIESILRESSPLPSGCREDGGETNPERRSVKGGGARGWNRKGRGDARKADQRREAISGAVDILSGLNSSSLPEARQRQFPLFSRRGSRAGLRLVRSRDRAVTPPRRERERLVGYWVPPGNIPSKVGERRKAEHVRLSWDVGGDDAEQERTLQVPLVG